MWKSIERSHNACTERRKQQLLYSRSTCMLWMCLYAHEPMTYMLSNDEVLINTGCKYSSCAYMCLCLNCMCSGPKVASMYICVHLCVHLRHLVCVTCMRACWSCYTSYLKCHKLSFPQMSVSWVHSSCIQHEVLCVPLHSVLLGNCVGAPQNTPLLETWKCQAG